MSTTTPSRARARKLPDRLTRRKAISVFVDIAGFSQMAGRIGDDDDVILFLDGFYDLVVDHLEGAGGDVIKYMGDASIAVFDETDAERAIDAVVNLRASFPAYADSRGAPGAELRASITLGNVVIGPFGRKGIRDVLGLGAAQAINTSGPGIVISEPVYRKLPAGLRSPWRKRTGRVTYHLS